MSRIFAYARVSTHEQNPENQIQEFYVAGFRIAPHRIVTEKISGSVPISQRNEFKRLLEKMESRDVLVVSKLDRLGRDSIDVSTTVHHLEKLGIKVHCLALGGVDLTSASGKLTMSVINAVAQFERDLLIERTQAGMLRAKSNGTSLGRPYLLSLDQKKLIQDKFLRGQSLSSIAREMKVSRQTVTRVRDAFEALKS